MFGIGTQELLIILLVALMLFGGKRIPEVARSIGTGLRDFRRAIRDVEREVDLEAMVRAEDRPAGGQTSANRTQVASKPNAALAGPVPALDPTGEAKAASDAPPRTVPGGRAGEPER